MKLKKEDWQQAKINGESMLREHLISATMARAGLIQIEEELAKFPAEKKVDIDKLAKAQRKYKLAKARRKSAK